MKKQILSLCITNGNYSIADLSDELGASVPTVTKLVVELLEAGYLLDLGKQGTSGGRRPSIYGLNPDAGHFIGIDCGHHHINIAIVNFKGELINFEKEIPFQVGVGPDSHKNLGILIREHVRKLGISWSSIKGAGISLRGRVNFKTGSSYTYFGDNELPVNEIYQRELGIPVVAENDSRAMAYGEYLCGVVNGEKNVLFINDSWGLGMGIINDGKLFYGISGFSGEIGHFPMLDNNRVCRCGKVGCLETGAAGIALHRAVIEKLKDGKASSLSEKFNRGEEIRLRNILKAVEDEDVLCIEEMAKIGEVLGRGLAGIINIFNPELVVLGGRLMVGKDYLMLPVQSSIKKHSLNMVSKDTTIKFST
ncbi:MAG: ROK family transcriptional regulator, partial [Bacteroidales bacterium]|nr:ROK family transcriptional regulator [Bacteroidales bacterium]